MIVIIIVFLMVYAVYAMVRLTRRYVSKSQRKKQLMKWFKDHMSGTVEKKKLSDVYVDLAFENLTLSLKSNGVKVVNGVTGIIKHGQVTAVMGLSGCGKTSFITALSGKAFYGNTTGNILVNGVDLNLTQLKKLVCFVPQEDVMVRVMSVLETLEFSAKTRLPKTVKNIEILDKCDSTLDMLGLTGVKSSLIGDENVRGISGGQRKRVNIGIELVANPVILFLDEPTSGLDSSSSQEVMDALKKIANDGINVITVIHQPRYEIFSQVDNLLLLGNGGVVIYMGEVKKVENYFKNLGFDCPEKVNVADFILDVCSGRCPDRKGVVWEQKRFTEIWEKGELPKIQNQIKSIKRKSVADVGVKKQVDDELKKRRVSQIRQSFGCVKRALIMRLRDLKGFYLDISLIICGAVILGVLFTGFTNKVTEIFKQSTMITLLLGLTGIMGSLNTLPGGYGQSRAVFIRENYSGLNPLYHYIAFNLTDLINILLSPLVFVCALFFLASPLGNFFVYYLIGVCMHWCSYGLGYIVTMLFGDNARIASIVILVTMNLVSGLVERLRDMKEWTPPANIFPYLSYCTFGTMSLFINEMVAFRKTKDIAELFDEKFGYREWYIYFAIPTIFLYGCIFRIIGFFCLISLPPNSRYNKTKNFVLKLVGLTKMFFGKCFYGMFNVICFKKGDKKVNYEEEEAVTFDEFETISKLQGSFNPRMSTFYRIKNEARKVPVSTFYEKLNPSFQMKRREELEKMGLLKVGKSNEDQEKKTPYKKEDKKKLLNTDDVELTSVKDGEMYD